ncbi:MAG: hypothetical protein WCY68_11125 [Desulfuromonadales bacterium]
MTIHEPMTLLTDWLLAGVVLAFSVRLAGRSRDWSVRLWATAFFASALAAIAGGAWHGFRPYLAFPADPLLWKLALNAIGLASFCLLAAAVFATLAGLPRNIALSVAAGKFLIYAGWMVTHDAFRFVIYDYGSAMLTVLLLQIPGLLRRRPAAGWIAGGILVSFVAAGVQATRLAPHPFFNHNDLYHIIQIGAFYLLYRGGRLLADRAP